MTDVAHHMIKVAFGCGSVHSLTWFFLFGEIVVHNYFLLFGLGLKCEVLGHRSKRTSLQLEWRLRRFTALLNLKSTLSTGCLILTTIFLFATQWESWTFWHTCWSFGLIIVLIGFFFLDGILVSFQGIKVNYLDVRVWFPLCDFWHLDVDIGLLSLFSLLLSVLEILVGLNCILKLQLQVVDGVDKVLFFSKQPLLFLNLSVFLEALIYLFLEDFFAFHLLGFASYSKEVPNTWFVKMRLWNEGRLVPCKLVVILNWRFFRKYFWNCI